MRGSLTLRSLTLCQFLLGRLTDASSLLSAQQQISDPPPAAGGSGREAGPNRPARRNKTGEKGFFSRCH